MMNDPGSTRDPVEQLAESFQTRLRRGEWPSLEEYTNVRIVGSGIKPGARRSDDTDAR
jgi:hypothetical protein